MSLNEQVLFLEKYGIDANEALFIQVLLLTKEGEVNKNYFQLPEKCRPGIREMLLSLQLKGIITKEYRVPNKGEPFIPEDVIFNKNLVKSFFKSSFSIGKELFETYPMFTTIDGNVVSLRGVAKKFDSLEDFYLYYGKSIKWDPETHEHILELINWAKDNTNFLSCSISTFVIERKWEEIEALKNGELGTHNYNAIRQI